MAKHPRRHATWTCATVTLLLTFLPISTVAQHAGPPPPPPPSYADYSPKMATVLIVIIGFFLTVGFLSIFFRHFAWCLGFDIAPRNAVLGGWRQEPPRGLDPSVVDSFPKFLYSDVKVHRIGKGALECAICLTEFSDEELLQMLPVCSHVFHPDCIAPWLAAHVTCPVCRANLEFQNRREHYEALLQQLNQQLSDDESEPLDQNQTTHHHHHHHDHVVVTVQPSPSPVKTPVQEIKDGGGRRGSNLPRSHSTGHSLIVDCERFTLRLPEEVRNKLVTANQSSVLPAMISPRTGYRARSVGCTGFPHRPDRWRFSASPPFITRSGLMWSPKSEGGIESSNNNNSTGFMSGPKSFLKSIKSPLNRGVRSNDIGERSSDKLWPNRRNLDIALDGQQ